MEIMDDRTIAEKLEELATLPAGYAPNLASKWDLLEASLERQSDKKRTLFVLARVAAVLVLFFSLWYWLLQGLSTQPVVQDEKNSPGKIQPVQNEVPVVLKEEVTGRAKSPVYKKPVPAAKDEWLGRDETPLTEPGPVQEVVPLVAEPAPSLAVEAAPAKKKKIRYVQMDFGDPVKETNTNAPAYYAKHPEFRMFGDHEPQQNTGQTNSRTAVVRINF